MVTTLQTGKPIDFSIMPSFRCNLDCWFCMYDCTETDTRELDYEKTKWFLAGFDWSQINAFGFYGGEPFISMPLYDKFIDLIPAEITQRFVITNGSWSPSVKQTTEFLNWCALHRFHIIISSTPWHIKYQHRSFLEALAKDPNSGIELKKPDEIHAQGRAKGKPGVITDCGTSCQRTDRNMRLGLKPDGNVVYQNCHGEYHIVQSYNEPFGGIQERAERIKEKCVANKLYGL